MNKDIVVDTSYKIGMNNIISATFNIDANETYFKRGLNDFTTFLTQVLNGQRSMDIVITVMQKCADIIDLETSKRFIIEDYKNGYQERSYADNQFPEVTSKTFGIEGSARKEMKKAIVKVIKAMQK